MTFIYMSHFYLLRQTLSHYGSLEHHGTRMDQIQTQGYGFTWCNSPHATDLTPRLQSCHDCKHATIAIMPRLQSSRTIEEGVLHGGGHGEPSAGLELEE